MERPAIARPAPIISFRGVSKSFGRGQGATPAVQDVSLDIAPGSFISLVGPSGCGKTTLLNLIAGLIQPDQGEVIYEGARVKGPGADLGYMTQQDALLPWRNVLSNVALALEVRKVPKAERLAVARAVIAEVRLKGFERHFPAQLSGGMRKRIALARTLIYRPKTLLLDEPFGALDAQTRIVIQQQLKELAAEHGLTVLLVTHDISEALALSDRIVVFSRRPAQILEIIDLPDRVATGPAAAVPGSEFEKIWNLLAGQIDIARDE